MATTVVTPRKTRIQPDRIFFPLMCLTILVTVWLGFSKTYYGVGMVRAQLPATIIHVHAVVMTLWLLTLVVQTSLVSVRKVKLHMAIGLWGFGLACIMPVIGFMAGVNSLRRNMSPPWSHLTALTFFIIPVAAVLTFTILAAFAYKLRRRPDYHKRLIFIATFALMDAAIGRFPYTLGIAASPLAQTIWLLSFPAIIVVYDLVTLRRIHRATWTASLFLAFAFLLGDFVFANLLAGSHYETLQVYLYNMRQTSGHFTSAIVMSYFLITLLLTWLTARFSK